MTSDSETNESSPPEKLLLADLASADSIETIYREIIELVRRFLKVDRCAVAFQQKNTLIVTESWKTTPELETASYGLLTSHPERALDNKQSYCFDDVTTTSSGSEPTVRSARPRSMICVPINDDNIIIVESLTRSAFTETDIECVEMIANVAEGALARNHTSHSESKIRKGESFGVDSLFDQFQVAAAILDAAGRVRLLNDAARELLRSYTDTMIGVPLWEAPCVEQSSQTRAQLREQITQVQDGETVQYQATYRSRILDVELQPMTDTDGNITSIIATACDLTEHCQQKHEDKAPYEQVEHALDCTDSYLWSADLDTEEAISFIGPVERILGIPQEQIDTIPSMLEYLVHPDDRDEAKQLITQLLNGGSDRFSFEHRTPFDSQDLRWFRISGGVDSSGGTRRVAGLITNITEYKKRELKLRRKNEQLDDFARVVSHDLRNPLNIAGLQLDLACRECDSSHLESVADAHDRMEVLIDDLLSLSRQGESITEIEDIELSTLLPQCWSSVDTKEATLEGQIDRVVRGDRSRLKQLFENLFRNAVEHGSKDVKITIDELDERTGLYVEDDGPGIPPNERNRIFEAGYSMSSDGTGLGLNIVNQIVEAHGWKITVTDSANDGTRFEIIFQE